MDLVLKLIGLAMFIAWLAVLAWFVPHIDLITVLVLVAAMAVYDLLVRPALIARHGRH
jgi:hypothetical protein